MEFQSLFFWMTLWKSMFLHTPRNGSEFQSLFFWMTLWKRSLVRSGRNYGACFNPCFSGWRSERCIFLPFWVCDTSFNPCFSGWRSESGDIGANLVIEVVSILVFLDDALKADRLKLFIMEDFKFQSLFFWMTLWKLIATPVSTHPL